MERAGHCAGGGVRQTRDPLARTGTGQGGKQWEDKVTRSTTKRNSYSGCDRPDQARFAKQAIFTAKQI